MKKILILPLTLTLAAASLTSSVLAAASTPQTVTLSILHAVKDDAGKITWVAVDKALPGEVLMQRVVITPTSDIRAGKLNIPVPKNTTYLGGLKLSDGASATYSLDTKTFSKQPMITVTENGKSVSKPAPINLYRNVQIDLPDLKAGSVTELSFNIAVD